MNREMLRLHVSTRKSPHPHDFNSVFMPKDKGAIAMTLFRPTVSSTGKHPPFFFSHSSPLVKPDICWYTIFLIITQYFSRVMGITLRATPLSTSTIEIGQRSMCIVIERCLIIFSLSFSRKQSCQT